jgi:hypothetical protein
MNEELKQDNQKQEHKDNFSVKAERNIYSTNKNEFKNYVFQFLMVFLGITAGFFVENIRENYVESQKAEEYAGSLYKDLAADTVNLHHAINLSWSTVDKIDTLLFLLNQQDISNVAGGKLYYYGALSLQYQNFIPNKSTINQLISTGSIQYFKNYSIEKSIADYNQALLVLNYQQETENRTYMEKVKFIETIFDGSILSRVLYKDLNQSFIDSFVNKNFRLLTYDRKELKEFSNFWEFRKQFLTVKATDMYKNPLNKAVNLIDELKKEYNLK